MSFVDYKYIGLISSRVERFKDNGNHVYQMRCKFCGDSKKKKSLARGYIYSKENKFRYHCHNCGASMSFGQFIKLVAPDLHMAYMVDSFSKTREHPPKKEKPSYKKIQADQTFLEKCIRLSSVDMNNPVYQYAIKRQIPEKYLDDLLACHDVNYITSKIDKYNNKEYPHNKALVIPFFDKNKNIPHLQCRMIEGNFRYLTLNLVDDFPKIYGLKYIDWRKNVYVTEGPIDSMFVPNCLAIGGLKNFKAMEYIENKAKQLTYIFDADWRTNKDVRQSVIEKIEGGFEVVLLQKDFGCKDINEYITTGKTDNQLMEYITKHTFGGLRAKLELTKF